MIVDYEEGVREVACDPSTPRKSTHSFFLSLRSSAFGRRLNLVP